MERGDFLAELGAVFAGTAHPTGAIVIEGAPGLGKTAMVNAGCHIATGLGLRVVSTRAAEGERDTAFGVIRQLLEAVAPVSDEVEAVGADDVAAKISRGDMAEWPNTTAVFHSLAAMLGRLGPGILVAVDDVHWADAESAAWLHFLARRLHTTGVRMLLSTRPRPAGVPLTAAERLVSDPSTRTFSLRPLSREAVRDLVGGYVGQPAEVHSATRVTSTRAGTRSSSSNYSKRWFSMGSVRLPRMSPSSNELSSAEVARSVLERVASIGPAALALLEAVAVLGGRADLRLSAALAVVNGDEAGPIADALAAVGLLRPGRPLDFVHRFVGASVYAEIPPARRSTAHAEAAQLLAALRPDGPAAAVHLLETEPRGKAWVVSSLLKAARVAIDRDDLVAARRFVARALAEPPAADQEAAVLRVLAEIEGRLGCPDAVDHFRDAGRLGVDNDDWAALGIMLAERFWGTPHAITVIDELQAAKDTFAARQPDLLARLELLVSAMPSALHRTERVDARVAGVAATVLVADEATRRLATAYVAAAGAADAATADISEILDVIRTSVTSEEANSARGPLAVNVMTQVLGVLVAAGRADLAEPLLWTAKHAAEARGDSSASAAFAIVLARSLATTGPLHAAEELVLEALNGTDDNTLRQQALLAWTQILASRGDLLGAAGALAGVDVAGWTGTGLFDTTVAFEMRGYLNLLGHRWSLALDDFDFTGAIAEKQGIRNPALASWRVGASHALIELGRLDRATTLSAENLELARRFGAPVPIAEALRCSARWSRDGAA